MNQITDSPLFFLSGRLQVKVDRNKGIEDVGDPGGHRRADVAVDGEGRGDRHEQDIGEAERQSDTDVHTHAALDLARRERRADRGQDKGGHDGRETLVILDLEGLDVAHAPFFLPGDIGVQLGTGHGLAVVDGDQEVRWDDGQRRVLARAGADLLFHVDEIAYHIIDHCPFVERVVLDGLGGQPRDQLLILEMLERETVAHVRAGIVAVEIGDHARLDLQLGIAYIVYLLVLDVLVLEVDTDLVGGRDDERVQDEGHARDDGRRDAIGQHEPPETHAAGQHRDDLRVVRQLRREEDDGDEGEQWAEQVREVGNEVQVIVHDDRLQRNVGVQELVDLLVDVEHDRDGYDQEDGEHVGSQELLDDIPVYPFKSEAHVLMGLFYRRFANCRTMPAFQVV